MKALVRNLVIAVIVGSLIASAATVALGAVPISLGSTGSSPAPPGAGGASMVSPTSGAAPTVAPALPANAAPPVVYHGPRPAHVPAAWGPDAIPPGASEPATGTPVVNAPSQAGPTVHGICVGKWPSEGQSAYTNGCIGHDEPAMNPFSDLPGSGGNVSWDVALPISAGPSHLQADTYIAIWFGMDLYDPFGYNGQCFLELQLYPDTNATTGAIQENAWAGFAVGWQIELATGAEDPCFAAPINEPNGNPLAMTGGDHLYVNMTGWVGSPFGETIFIDDKTNGATSALTLFNTTGNYPLDPAFSTNNVEDSLPWSPGGDLPVAFAFESGHTVDDPENDTFGGCNSGVPPPNPLNPSTPCGSYNPRAWAQDTQVPWRFYSVTFFNALHHQTAAQFGFEQDFGATAWIDGLSYGSCDGRDGSAYCSYPWYSYSASEGAFNFGATDYANTSQDFGQYNEYDSTLVTDSSGLNFYPVRNVTYSDPAGDSLRIVIHGHGTAYFLDNPVTRTMTFKDLPRGAYSLNAWSESGSNFEGYTGTGGVELDAISTAFSSFQLTSNGTLTVKFGASPLPSTPIQFKDTGGHGSVTIVAGFSFPLSGLYPPAGFGFPLVAVFASSSTTAASGQTLKLVPGIYSLQSDSSPGYNFVGFSSSSAGAYLYTPESNYTWVNLTGSAATITAHYVKSSATTTVWFASYPAQGGKIDFNGVVYTSGTVVTVRLGAYSIAALANPGYSFVTWGAGLMATITDWAPNSTVLAQAANIYITAAFSSTPNLVDGSSHGSFSVNGATWVGGAKLPQVGNQNYVLASNPDPGYAFSSWTVSNAHGAWIAAPNDAITSFQLNGSVTITANFVPESVTHSLSIVSLDGTVQFDGVDSFSGYATLGGLGRGVYRISAVPAAGYEFNGWSVSGGASVTTFYWLSVNTFADVQNLAGTWTPYYSVHLSGSGTLAANFEPIHHPVTFVDFPYDTTASVHLTASGYATTIGAGHTVELPPGTYTATYRGTLTSFAWFATSNISVSSPHATVTLIHVSGSGTLYVVAEPSQASVVAHSVRAGPPSRPAVAIPATGVPSAAARRA